MGDRVVLPKHAYEQVFGSDNMASQEAEHLGEQSRVSECFGYLAAPPS